MTKYVSNFYVTTDHICLLPQLDIWKLCLGQSVHLNQKFKNPFRTSSHSPNYKDRSKGVWLWESKYTPGLIVMADFADKRYNYWNCVKAYAYVNNLSFQRSLEILCKKYIPKKSTLDFWLNNKDVFISQGNYVVKKKELEVHPALWRNEDTLYWGSYGIPIEDLIKDGVHPVNRYKWSSWYTPQERCYWIPSTSRSTKGKLYTP